MVSEVKSIVDLFAILTKHLTDQVEPEHSLSWRYLLPSYQLLHFMVPFHVVIHGSKFPLHKNVDHEK